MLDNIRIVLVNTSHPGNIGAAARAMKNMGLKQLYLVEPLEFPSVEAYSRAAGADDLLAGAVVVDSLQEAVGDCVWVAGTSARLRTVKWQIHDPRECVAELAKHIEEGGEEDVKVAIVFGRERTGLSNEELELCNSLVHIPSNPDYSSLNVAAAVQVLSYECRMAALASGDIDQPQLHTRKKHREDIPADAAMLESMYGHLQQTLQDINFFYNSSPEMVMRRFKSLFNRAATTRREVALLRGLFSAAQGKKQPRDKESS